MVVHQAVLDAAEAGQAAAAALSQQGKVVGDLRYWSPVLVPLGKRERDGRVMSEGTTSIWCICTVRATSLSFCPCRAVA